MHWQRMSWWYGFGLVVVALAAIVAGWLDHPQRAGATRAAATPTTTAAAPGQAAGPIHCRIGLDLVSLQNFNIARDTFDAEFWFWTVCPTNQIKPLTTTSFVNADSIRFSYQSEDVVNGQYWSSAQVDGTFRTQWDLRRYPFDHPQLMIEVENSQQPTANLVFEPDQAGSAIEANAVSADWKITDFRLTSAPHMYQTNFGDPTERTDTSEFTRLVATFELRRTELTSFFKLTFVVYVAFLISLISYFLHLHNTAMLTARLSVISGTLFAVAVNLRTATAALSNEKGLTLVDYIHIVALVAILIDALAALATQVLVERGRPQAVLTRFNRIVMLLVVAGFIAANGWLIGRAALG